MRRRRRSAAMIDRQWEMPSQLGWRISLASLIQTLAVTEYLNFRHAANAMGISQSGVSARVKAREEDLGILLFERYARGVRLTEAGRHFVERVTTGIDQLDHAVRTASMVARGEHGRLRVGIHALIPGGFLANLIERYREQHPGNDVQIAEGTARESVVRIAGLTALRDQARIDAMLKSSAHQGLTGAAVRELATEARGRRDLHQGEQKYPVEDAGGHERREIGVPGFIPKWRRGRDSNPRRA